MELKPMKRTTTYKPHSKSLLLEEYPVAIAEVRAAIARLDQRLFDLKADIKRREAQFDIWVGENAELRNDTQRRAALHRHRYDDVQYQGWLALAQNLEEQRTQQEIKLELLRSAFTVAKLQARQAIADQLACTEGFSLVA